MSQPFYVPAISAPSNPAFTAARFGRLFGQPAFGYNFTGRRVNNNFSTTAQTDVAEFALTNDRIPILAGNQNVEIVSSSTADAAAGTGVRTVELVYLDSAYNLQSTTVTLNGIIPVTVQLAGTNILPQAIWWMHSVTVGSGSVAAGNIRLRIATAGAELEQITAGGNMSLSARMCVPAGYTGYLDKVYASAVNGDQDVRLRATLSKKDRTILDGVYNFQEIVHCKEGGSNMKDLPYLVMPPTTRIKLSTISSIASGRIEASFSLVMVKNF